MTHNPHLTPWARPKPNRSAGKGEIEQPNEAHNIVWQTRSAPPTDYENSLADAFEVAFAAGIDDIAALVDKLNELGVRTPQGQAWDVAGFEAEMKRLGY